MAFRNDSCVGSGDNHPLEPAFETGALVICIGDESGHVMKILDNGVGQQEHPHEWIVQVSCQHCNPDVDFWMVQDVLRLATKQETLAVRVAGMTCAHELDKESGDG